MGYTYTSKELTRTARGACKGMGRYLRWELRVGTEHLSLIVYYVARTGEERSTNCAI